MERKQKPNVGQESKKPFPKMRPDAEELMKTISTLPREEIFAIRMQLAGKGIASKEKTQVDRLCEASSAGDVEMVQEILGQGADINGFGAGGSTALFFAADESNDTAETVEFLLKNGADPNIAVYGSRETPLHASAFHGEIESVKLLLEAGADPNAVNKNDQTPLMMAAMGLGMDVVEFLMDEGIGEADKLQVGRSDNVALMGLLIEKGAKLHIPEPEIRTFADVVAQLKIGTPE